MRAHYIPDLGGQEEVEGVRMGQRGEGAEGRFFARGMRGIDVGGEVRV
jgi:hypothetical protein